MRRGIDHCRRGEWHLGLRYLRQVEGANEGLPGLYWSYLGHAIARCERRYEEGVAACERGVAMDFYQPEAFLNLAWTRLLARDRRGALDAVLRGLALDPRHAELANLERRLGRRQRPMLPFLTREHALNRLLGRLRCAWIARRNEG